MINPNPTLVMCYGRQHRWDPTKGARPSVVIWVQQRYEALVTRFLHNGQETPAEIADYINAFYPSPVLQSDEDVEVFLKTYVSCMPEERFLPDIKLP